MTLDLTTMDASDRLLHEVGIAMDASIGVIIIRCPQTEVFRVVDDLYSHAMGFNTNFRLHTSETGWCEYTRIDPNDKRADVFNALEPRETDKGTADALKAFQALWNPAAPVGSGLTYPKEGIYVMLDLYFQFGEKVAQTCIRKQVQQALDPEIGQRLFLIVPQHFEVPEPVADMCHIIDLDFPTRAELQQSLVDIIDGLKDEAPELSEDEISAIVSNGQGMTTTAFETAVALSITQYGASNEKDDEASSMEGFGSKHIMDQIREYKTALLRKTNVLELQPTVDEDDIGGLDLFKEWMHQRKLTYTERARDNGVTPSRGALVIGPPGTGKSMVAKAAGSILNLPVIRFDVGRVFGSYVGQSEQAMRGALKMLDAMAPIVLMLDEIDKGFAGMTGGANDSGTTQRVFGTFLTWMQERDQVNRPVFLIMTANRIGGLPPELLRKGRVDEIFSVNVPNDVERGEIVKIHLRKRKQEEPDDSDLAAMVRITDQLVGAEIEGVIEDALVLSLGNKKPGVTFELLETAKGYLKPMHRTRAEEFREMKQWADNNARPASSAMLSSGDPETPTRHRAVRGKKRPVARVSRGNG